ncbi:MAG TPA: CHAT domain-containing protein [Candidatus Polarisedimenticolia bacterium]|nr:CHAT domain-containing protein [Candidatus Polarisedimenticolia bacterium]
MAGLRREADAHLDARRFEEASRAFRRILALDPEHPQAFLGSVLSLARQGKLTSADEVLAGLSPAEGPGRTYGRAVALFLSGRIEESKIPARTSLDGYLALAHKAGEAAARTLVGNISLKLGDPDGAAWQYRRAADLLEQLADRRGQADILDNLGGVEYERGRLREALAHYESALRARRGAGDRGGEARTWNNLGLARRRLGDRKGAIQAFERSLALRDELADERGKARTLDHLGLVHLDGGEAERAASHFDRAAAISRQVQDDRGLANSLTNLGLANQARREIRQAIQNHDEALALRGRLGDESGRAESHRNLASCWEATGNAAEARRHIEEALAIAAGLRNARTEGALLRSLGSLLQTAGEWEEAVHALQRSLERLRSAGDLLGEAEALEDLGNAQLAGGDYAAAQQAFDASLALFRKEADRSGEASVLDRMGVLRTRLGQFSQAVLDLGESRRLASLADDRKMLAAATSDLASLKFALGDLTEALGLQNEALAMQRKTLDREGEIASLNNLSAIERALGRKDRAVARIREALLLSQPLPDRRTEALLRNNLGLLLAESELLEEALAEQRRSGAIREELGDQRGGAFTRLNLAATLRRMARRDEALEMLREAQEAFQRLREPRGEALARIAAAGVLSEQGRLEEAVDGFREALPPLSRLGLREEEAFARGGLALALERSGEPAGAIEEYLRAIGLIEMTRARLVTDPLKIVYFEDKVGLHRAAVRLLVQRYASEGHEADAARAFEIHERARARALIELLAESRMDLRAGVDPRLLEQEEMIGGRLAAALSRRVRSGADGEDAAAEIGRIEEELDLLRVRIRAGSPAYSHVRYPRPLSLKEMQASVLGDDEVLLEYSLGEEASVLWQIEKTRTLVRLLPGREEVEAQVRELAAALAGAGLAGDAVRKRAAATLGRWLLPERLPEGRRLLIVPDGALHHLPFEALPAEGRYLIEKHEIAYLPSASTLELLRSSRTGARRSGFLGIGDPPASASLGFPRLPHSREELQKVAARYPQGQVRLLLGADATKKAMRSAGPARFGILHFATHALIDEEEPSRSGILLGGDLPGEHLLTLNEIFGLRLSADLVILSACRTGRGRLTDGEGIVGMTRGFLFAGARAVSVSLWNVSDRSTAELMRLFHQSFSAGRPAAAALREAKLAMLASSVPGYRDPGRWAPFVLVGAPD